MIDRRAFLRRLGFGTVSAAAAALTFDVEKLLWRPGEKTIVLPPPPTIVQGLVRGDVLTFDGVYAIHPVTHHALDVLQQFVITDDVVSAPVTQLPLWPKVVLEGPYRTVSSRIAANAKPILYGSR